jgi:hypothetical protein
VEGYEVLDELAIHTDTSTAARESVLSSQQALPSEDST